MNLAIMQPTFNPWLGYFDLIDYVDKFIFFDTVQLNQQSWQTRNKIKAQDKELIVSIPIKKNKSKNELLIKDTLINYLKFDFRKKLTKTLEQNYNKSKYFNEVWDFIKNIILYDTEYLSEYNINLITKISYAIGISTNFVVLSQTDFISLSKKGDLVLDICKKFNTSRYISPLGSKEYLMQVVDKFLENNISIYYQNYTHPAYQQFGEGFIAYTGIIDLLFNEGFENSLNIIREGRSYENC